MAFTSSQWAEPVARRLFENGQDEGEMSTSGCGEMRVGLGGLEVPRAGLAVLGEVALQLVTVSSENGIRPAREQFADEEWEVFFKDGKEPEMRFVPFKVPEPAELPSYTARVAEAATLKKQLPLNEKTPTFEPLFQVDEQGNPVSRSGAAPVSSVSSIVALAWHPYRPVLAVAMCNGCICFYDVHTGEWQRLVLRHAYQTSITSVEWNPVGGNQLAVTSARGICLWKLVWYSDPGSSSSTASGWMTLLTANKQPRKASSMSFSPCGRFLAGCFDQPYLQVWELCRPGDDGLTLLPTIGVAVRNVEWARNGDYVVASSGNSNSMFVWDTLRWQIDRWTTAFASCNRVQFHPTDCVMLLNECGSSLISSVRLSPVCSETLLDVGADDELNGMGGTVDQMRWSPDGRRLAISFQNGEPAAHLLAVLAVDTRGGDLPRFTPIALLAGPEGKHSSATRPVAFAFRPHFNRGSLLAVSWSRGETTFYPLVYN